MSESDLSALLEEIRERNELTGPLYGGLHYYQILEGARSTVTTTCAKIEQDKRHTDISDCNQGGAERKFQMGMGFPSSIRRDKE